MQASLNKKYTQHDATTEQDEISHEVHGIKKRSLQGSMTVHTDHEELTILECNIHTSIRGLQQQCFILKMALFA
jgi:hypothetical protein